jgi:hypothetical protein
MVEKRRMTPREREFLLLFVDGDGDGLALRMAAANSGEVVETALECLGAEMRPEEVVECRVYSLKLERRIAVPSGSARC